MNTLPPVNLLIRLFRSLQSVAAGSERADVLAVLEEERDFVRIDRELAPERDVLIGMLVNDLVFVLIGPRDHHLLRARLDEIDDPHVFCFSRALASRLAAATRDPDVPHS